MASDTDSWIETLKNEKGIENHAEAYSRAIDYLQKSDIEEETALIYEVLITAFERDFRSKIITIADGAVRTFIKCIQNSAFRKEIAGKKFSPLITSFLFSSASTKILQDCFRELYLQCSTGSLVDHGVLINVFYEAVKGSTKSMQEVVKLEILKFISQIMNEKVKLVNKTECHCLELTLVYSVNESETVRKNSLRLAKLVLLCREDWNTHVVELASCLKQQVTSQLKLLSSNSLLEILTQQCPLYLRVLGVNIRKTSSVMNSLLSIIEQGFRNTNLDTRIASFELWGCLINVFAENVAVLSSARYMKLIMQPLSSYQTEEEISVLKIKLLWLLANKLGPKLPELFNTVCLPMVHCCLGNLDPSRSQQKNSGVDSNKTPIKGRPSSGGSPNVSENVNLYSAMQSCGYRATPRKASNNKRIQIFGIEILVHLLQPATEDHTPPFFFSKFTLKKLDIPVLNNPSTFTSHGQLFITAVSEVLCHMGLDITDCLAEVLWNRLFHHIKSNLEANLKKKKRETELFNLLLLTIQNVVAAESLTPNVAFEMVKKFLEIPNTVLSSTFYGGSLNGMHGIPAVCLLKVLFSKSLIPVLLHESSDVAECTDKLISCVFENEMRVLSLIQTVVDTLHTFAGSLDSNLPDEDDRERIFGLISSVWNKLGCDLNHHLTISQDVNQGDNLEHDFSAVYSFLLFPLFFNMPSSNFIGTWMKLYKSFIWCGNLVTTCKPNEICQYISNELLKNFENLQNSGNTDITSQFSTLSDIVRCMVVNAEYNHEPMEKLSRASLSSAVPTKSQSGNRLVLDLHNNLEGICQLLHMLLSAPSCQTSTNSTALLESLKHIFSGIHNNKDIRSLFSYSLPVSLNLLRTRSDKDVLTRDLMTSVLLSVQKSLSNWIKPDSKIEYLTNPDVIRFLSEGLKHKDRKMKQIMTEFWQKAVFETFHHENVCKLLPDEFKNLLYPVYRRLSWSCPWQKGNFRKSSSDELSESSENISQDTQLPIYAYGAFGSPLKKHSFLTPKKTGLNISPMKKTISSPANAAKRKLNSVHENVKYVKCFSPLRKDVGPLTDHQKEKMKNKSYIPPMYNDLDNDTCDLEQAEVDTQIELDKNKDEVVKGNLKEDTEIDEVVIESSQDSEKETSKNSFVAKNKKLAAVADEVAPRRSGRTRKPNLSKFSDSETTKRQSGCSEVDDKISAKRMKGKDDVNMEPQRKEQKSLSNDKDVSEENKKLGGKKNERTSSNQNDIIKESLTDKVEEGKKDSDSDGEDISEKSSFRKRNDATSEKSLNDKKGKTRNRVGHDSSDDETSIEISPGKSKQNLEVGQVSPEIDTTNELEETDDNFEVSDQDTSYEYVAIMDASTNQTQGNISIDDEEDDDCKTTDECKDLGVSPLDESYEYVAVADMSVNNMTINKSQCLNATYDKEESEVLNADEDPEKTDLDESGKSDEYEYVALADMSTNMSVLVSKLDCSKYSTSMMEELKNSDDAKDKDAEAVGDHMDEDDEKLESSTDELQAIEEGFTDYISSDEDVPNDQHETGEEDAESTKEEEDFAEASMAEADDSEVIVCSTDESMTDADTTGYSEFMDAHSSLGGQPCNMSGELFNSSVCEIDKSSVEETILVSDASFSDYDKSVNDTSMNADDDVVFTESLKSPSEEVEEIVKNNIDSKAQGLELSPSFESTKAGSISSCDVSSTIHDSKFSADDVDHEEVEEGKGDSEIEDPNVSVQSTEKNEDKEIEKHQLEENKIKIGKDMKTEIRAASNGGSNQSPPNKTFELPVLANLRKNAADSPFESPSARGILKRRMTVALAVPRSPSPTNKRRVSFAEPISKSVKVENSPSSTLQFRKKQSPKSVNRRLSLPADKNSLHSTDIQVSPLSIRSARVAEAIATIRAKENCLTSPSSRRQTFTYSKSRILESNENREDNKDIKNITLQDIGDTKFLSQLSTSQHSAIFKYVLTAMPMLYQMLEEKLAMPE